MNGKYRFLSLLLCICLTVSTLSIPSVSAADVHYPETTHPYKAKLDDEGELFLYEGEDEKDVKALRITFSEDTETEEGFDVIRLYGSKGQLVGEYSGKELAGKTVITPGVSFYISLTSDARNQAYGYRIISVEPLFAVNYTFVTNGGSDVQNICDATVDSSPRTTKEGMYFAGWYDNAELSGKQISFPYRSDTDITLYAAWTDVPCTNVNDFEYEISGKSVMITAYLGYDSEIFIPAEIEDIPVTSLDASVFSGTAVKTVNIGGNITSIDTYAFDGCTSLTKISVSSDNPSYVSKDGVLFSKDMKTLLRVPCGTSGVYVIPEETVSIGNNAFNACNLLTGVTFSKNITSIPAKAFYSCKEIYKFTIPSNVTAIGENAFYGCTKLSEISVSDSVASIGKEAFNNTAYYNNSDNWENGILYVDRHAVASSKTDVPASFSLRDGTLCIADYTFYKNSSIVSSRLPDSVIYIGSYAFFNCTKLSTVNIPGNVRHIGDYAFSKCTSLKSADIPDSVTTIGKMGIFDGCTSLASVSLGKGISATTTNMFKGCTALKSVVLTNKTTEIAKNTFSGCNAISDVTFKGTESQWKSLSVKAGNDKFLSADITFDTSDVWSKGDLNHDGKCNTGDSVNMRLYILGKVLPDENETFAADMNSDGKINPADEMLLILMILGRITFVDASAQ